MASKEDGPSGVATWPSGARYEGDWARGLPHGTGTMKEPGGEVYTGGFSAGVRHGKGRLTFPDGTVLDTQFERGVRVQSVEELEVTYPDGARYVGPMVDGKREGRGMLTLHNGETYEGDFVANLFEGRGTFRYITGAVYQGSFEAHYPQGVGSMAYLDGTRYEGHWALGKRNGTGTLLTTEGWQYTCEWKDDAEVDGRARVEWPSGDVFEGYCVRGVPSGTGRMVFASGDVHVGAFARGRLTHGRVQSALGWTFEGSFDAEGRRHGLGVLTSETGDVVHTSWDAGSIVEGPATIEYAAGGHFKGTLDKSQRRQGQGELVTPTGDTYTGPFLDDVPHGKGSRCVFSDGRVFIGEYVKGEMVSGRMSEVTGEIYEGFFNLGKRHGNGKVTSASGEVTVCPWMEGMKQGRGIVIDAHGNKEEVFFKDNRKYTEAQLKEEKRRKEEEKMREMAVQAAGNDPRKRQIATPKK